MNDLVGRRGEAAVGQGGRRVLLYSHDTFGLGHLRRSRTIAQALTAADPALSALIMTGSPIAGRFDFPDRVDHVRLPGVVKLPDGAYASHNLGVDIEETVKLRSALLLAAEETFDPDLLIVDKEAWGFRNELAPTLARAKARGARLVLGIRDVLDEPETLKKGSIEQTDFVRSQPKGAPKAVVDDLVTIEVLRYPLTRFTWQMFSSELLDVSP